MRLLRLLLAGLLLHGIAQPVAAQLLDPGFRNLFSLYAPGTIYALGPQQADNKRVIAGSFARINGSPAFGLARLDANGTLDAAFQQQVGGSTNVLRVRSLPGGQYLLASGGGAVGGGGLARSELLRLNANGSADASFDVGTGPYEGIYEGYSTEAVAQPDGKIIVAGGFDTFNGAVANGAVRLNVDGSVDGSFSVGSGFDINSGETANTIAVQPDGKVLLGGYFSTFKGQPADALVRVTATGSRDASFAPPLQNAYVEGIVLQPDSKVLAYGNLIINGASFSLVRLNTDGSLDNSFTPLARNVGSITTLFSNDALVLLPNGKLLVSGSFVVNNQPTKIMRLNADGSLDNSFQLGASPSSTPFAVGVQADGSILAGGAFYSFNGSEYPLGRLTSSGAADPAFAPIIQTTGLVTAVVEQADGRVIIGGNFTEVNGRAVHRLARLSSTGFFDLGYAAITGVLPAPVTNLLLQPDGKLLVGTAAGPLRLLPGGSPDSGFTTTFTSNVSAMALQPDGRIMLGVISADANYRYLVRLTANGSYDPSFVRPITSAGPGSPSVVDGIVVQPDGRIVVSELFSSAGQPQVARVVRYLANGPLDPGFDYSTTFTANGPTPHLYALALQPDGKLLVGGNLRQVNGAARTGPVRLTATGALDASFMPTLNPSGPLYNITVQPNGRILLSGNFANTGGATSYTSLARVLADGQTDTSFGNTASPNIMVRSLIIQADGGILMVGNFFLVGGQPALGVARVVAADVLAVAAPAAVAARTSAWPVPAHGRLHVAPDARAQPQSLELLDALGRSLHQQPATAAPEQTLDLAGLPTGLYLLRVHYAAGTVTQRVSVY